MSHRPRYRVRPPANWINDPNGPVRWGGRHHLFYQHNPEAPVHTNVHWGHASSADLAHWDDHGIALRPVAGGPDEAGCWSGCVVDDDGVATAVYSGIRHGHQGLSAICLAVAEDDGLLAWKQLPEPVVPGPPPGLDVTMFRDPFVFRFAGRRWALVGAGHADGTPSVLVYDCEDLYAWRFAGVLLDGRDPVAARVFGTRAIGWECPQLWASDGGWTLAVALWDGDPLSTAYLAGQLVESDGGLRFAARGGGPLDHGRDFYAPAVLQDAGRALLWGWSWEARAREEVERAGWSGVLTAPRVVALRENGTLRVAPAPELELLRGNGPFGAGPLPSAYDLLVTARSAATVRLLRAASGAELAVRIDPSGGTVTVDRAGWPRTGRDDGASLVLPGTAGRALAVRILVDGSLFEVFVGDRVCATERVYQRADDVAELAVSGADVEVSWWELGPPNPG
ncbi:glycoside hydrolase family 32 protein [Streptomyces niveiscabiei]|uniref:glycoside hydrolase family 32 protein n=1 Tax=Streptomyces niveiscabiei TaxID=164115 RepID=UPI0006EBD4A5|nr:glycoside hydrolase family 32 protein [Streptomyces niveiscabiei]